MVKYLDSMDTSEFVGSNRVSFFKRVEFTFLMRSLVTKYFRLIINKS